MKLITPILTILPLFMGAVAQDGGGQGGGLQDFIDYRNPQLVGTCIIVAPGILATCQLSGNLTTSGEVRLANISIGIRTCGSALSLSFTLSDGTIVDDEADRIQCDTRVVLGQLTVLINVAVFINDANFTVINTSVTVNQGDGDVVPLFNSASIPLTQQKPITDRCGGMVTPPPDNCTSSTTTMSPKPTTTPQPVLTTTPQPVPTTEGEDSSGTTLYNSMLVMVAAATLSILHYL